MSTRSIRFAIFPLVLALSPALAGQDRSTDISISINAKANSVRSGSPLVIEATLKNISDHEIYIVPGADSISVDVLDASGTSQPAKRPASVEKGDKNNPSASGMVIVKAHSGSAKFVPMAAGETWTHQMIVTQTFDLSKPGVYRIQAKHASAGAVLRSNALRISVTQ